MLVDFTRSTAGDLKFTISAQSKDEALILSAFLDKRLESGKHICVISYGGSTKTHDEGWGDIAQATFGFVDVRDYSFKTRVYKFKEALSQMFLRRIKK